MRTTSSPWILFASTWLLCAACATSVDSDAADGVEEVPFLDSVIFDGELSAALRGEPETVIVEPASPFSVNDIPGRIDKWLYAVQDSGGQVVALQEMPPEGASAVATRGFLTEGVDAIILVTEYIVEWQTYEPAEKYDVTIHHDQLGQVRKVTFTKR